MHYLKLVLRNKDFHFFCVNCLSVGLILLTFLVYPSGLFNNLPDYVLNPDNPILSHIEFAYVLVSDIAAALLLIYGYRMRKAQMTL